METLNDLPVLLFANQVSWRDWLANNHVHPGVWLKIAKKASGISSVNYAQALEEALCFGWIDSQKRSYDEQFFLQKFTPRKAKSVWSKVNVEKIEQLTQTGKMRPAGLAAVELAKQDGRWEAAYDSNSTMVMPSDFQSELDKHPEALKFYATLNRSNTYAFLWRLQTAKKPETRQARIEKYVEMLEKGETLH